MASSSGRNVGYTAMSDELSFKFEIALMSNVVRRPNNNIDEIAETDDGCEVAFSSVSSKSTCCIESVSTNMGRQK